MRYKIRLSYNLYIVDFYNRDKEKIGFAYFYKNDDGIFVCNCYEYFSNDMSFFFKVIKNEFGKAIIVNNFFLGTDIFNGRKYIEV